MKNKYVIALFVIGIITTFIGALFKITHWCFGVLSGTYLITIGLVLEAITFVIFIVKLILNKNNNFLNQ